MKVRRFFAGVVQSLQAETDAKKGYAASKGLKKRSAETALVQCANQRGKVPDTGKQQSFCRFDRFRCRSTQRFRAEALERSLYRGDISYTIVNQREFHISPLVLGSIRASRLSFAHATRRALANALKTASM